MMIYTPVYSLKKKKVTLHRSFSLLFSLFNYKAIKQNVLAHFGKISEVNFAFCFFISINMKTKIRNKKNGIIQ
jgi:hypothetical protein